MKMYNFLLKNAVCSNGMKKNIPNFLKRALQKKKELCECHGGGVD